MATIYWKGTADAVAQVSSAGIDTYDGSTTYGITIGGVTVSVAADTDEETTTDNLVTALNASTHPYFAAITWARTGSTTSSAVSGTADTAGVPFTFTTYANGGSGDWNAVSADTANSGPNDWATADNWSGGAVPVDSDDVIVQDSATNICWGLDQSAVALSSMTVKRTFTGKIGLRYTEFATSSDGETRDTSKPEYRDTYLKIGMSDLSLGEHFGPGSPAGSGRIKIDLHDTACDATIHGTANTSAETGLPAVRLLADSDSTNVYVRSAQGGAGIAVDVPGEASEVAKVSISDTTSRSRVSCGAGVTLDTWEQAGGTNVLNSADTITAVTVDGGSLQIEGEYTITTLEINGGSCACNNAGSPSVTTANLYGGSLDTQGSNQSRTFTTVNLYPGASILGDSGNLTITTLNEVGGKYTITSA